MGSLYSKPKMPDPVIYAPPAPAVPAPATSPAADADGDSTEAARAAAIARKRTLPETILTSFRGVLSTGAWAPQRKSLLGE